MSSKYKNEQPGEQGAMQKKTLVQYFTPAWQERAKPHRLRSSPAAAGTDYHPLRSWKYQVMI